MLEDEFNKIQLDLFYSYYLVDDLYRFDKTSDFTRDFLF